MVPPRTLGDTFFLYMAYDQKSNLNNLFGIYDRKDTADLTHVLDTSIFGMRSAQSTSNVAKDVKFWQIMHFLHILTQNLHFISCDMQINTSNDQPEHAGFNCGRGDAHIMLLIEQSMI